MPRGMLVALALTSVVALSSDAYADDGAFIGAGVPRSARADSETAISLDDGRVLIAGGEDRDYAPLTEAELYDPLSDRFISTGVMSRGREDFAEALLPDGRVLFAGGLVADKDPAPPDEDRRGGGSGAVGYYGTRTAEIFDPATGAFTPTGELPGMRFDSSAVTLQDGRVLIAGGIASLDPDPDIQPSTENANTALVYSPVTGTFTSTGSMADGRQGPSAALLQDGRVLIAGGGNPKPLASAELYDPATGSFRPTGSMSAPRTGATTTVLEDGRVLILNGWDGNYPDAPAFGEIYDPATSSFTRTRNADTGRVGATATLLKDGRVLVAGGYRSTSSDSEVPVRTAEIYDPSTNGFSDAGQLQVKRIYPAASRLPDGRVLIVGGREANGPPLRSSEIYDPDAEPASLSRLGARPRRVRSGQPFRLRVSVTNVGGATASEVRLCAVFAGRPSPDPRSRCKKVASIDPRAKTVVRLPFLAPYARRGKRLRYQVTATAAGGGQEVRSHGGLSIGHG